MKEYLSEEPVWFEPTQRILEIKDKTLLIRKGESLWEADVRVEKAPDNSRERGKVSVMAWHTYLSGEDEWTEVKAVETEPPKYSEIGQWRRFLTQDALDLIHPRNSESPWRSDFELVLPSEPESLDH
jgi:hypothetical protein